MTEKLKLFEQCFRGKRVAVLGIGVSNLPLIGMLARCGAHVCACDRRSADQLAEELDALKQYNITYRLGEGYLSELDAEVIFKTPSMRYDLPQLVRARENGARVTSEMEVFFDLCPARLIAVTGSDGKTTTTTLISKMLEAAGYRVWLGGNIGRPLLGDIAEIEPDDVAVLELSSFQLHTMHKSPGIAVITNLSPNHLDVHRDMDEYIDAKKNIFRYQKPTDLLVLNYDNAITHGFADEAEGQVRYFSARCQLDQTAAVQTAAGDRAGGSQAQASGLTAADTMAQAANRAQQAANAAFTAASSGEASCTGEDGCAGDTVCGAAGGSQAHTSGVAAADTMAQGVYLKDETIYVGSQAVLPVSDIRLPGRHNVENYMAAIAAVWELVDVDAIVQVATTFGGVEHRIEFVRELRGVRYYNDSIASSPTRATAGLRSFGQKVILIAGGYDKHIPFDDFGAEIKEHVKELFLLGVTAPAIDKSARRAGMDAITHCESLADAVARAAAAAQPGDVVLLSPACASFDMFKNFAERGNAFKALVHGLQ